jgi:hypothetical protein
MQRARPEPRHPEQKAIKLLLHRYEWCSSKDLTVHVYGDIVSGGGKLPTSAGEGATCSEKRQQLATLPRGVIRILWFSCTRANERNMA